MNKKILIVILSLLLVGPMNTYAKEKEIYYTNLNGAEMTEVQYNNLKKVFNNDTIATLEKKQVDYLKNNKNLYKIENTKYIKIDDYYDNNGNIINRVESVVTEEEAQEFLYKNKDNNNEKSPTHTTNMKSITISLVPNYSVKTITITNIWLSLPSTRSYDVIGFRNGTGTSVSINSVSGYQNYDNNIISYTSSSGNLKTTTNGCGISMNIVDSVSSSLSNGMTVTIWNNSTIYTAYGSYQHAITDVTLSQSQNYSINANGLGGVLDFASSVRGYYDGMQGVDITGSVY